MIDGVKIWSLDDLQPKVEVEKFGPSAFPP
jgi:hypothetical protein